MMILHSSWMGLPNFSLVPVTLDCPFVEALFEPSSRNLVVFSKSVQTKFRMLPKVNENGDTITPKHPRPNKEKVCEERKQMESFVEHYISEPADIRAFIAAFVVNPTAVDFEKFLVVPEAPAPAPLAKV